MKIGDVVYAYDFSSDKVYEATIRDIADENCRCIFKYTLEAHYAVDEDGTHLEEVSGVLHCNLSNIWSTAIEAYKTKTSHNRYVAYCNEITDLASLLRFPLCHDISSENKDHDAWTAYLSKSAEIIGMRIV